MGRFLFLSLTLAGFALFLGCSDPVQPQSEIVLDAPQFEVAPAACWGQATKVFAKTGEMGEHASQQPSPRLGLANLARALYLAGEIPEPTMQALGAFVADALGLSIDACM